MIAVNSPRNMQSSFILILGLVHSLNGDVQHQSPLETMADVTNDFGVCVLQIISTPHSNMVFSPYGLVSMALLVYEGATGQAAAEIYNTLHLPWHRDIVRIGFRDLHRYLRSYFSSEGFLKGLVLSKPNVHLRPQYVEVLKFYGFQPDTAITQAIFTTQMFSLGNETTTTNVPVTSTITVPTTLTTMKEVMTTAPDTTTTFGAQNKTETVVLDTTTPTITTTFETGTEIVTATNKVPTQPEVLAMQGPVTTTGVPTTHKPTITTVKPGETTLLTTIVGETSTKETVPTEPTETQTVLPVTFPTQKTTMRIATTTEQSNTETTMPPKELITTLPPTKAIVNQEMQTEVVTEMKGTTLPSTKTTETQETETVTTEMYVVTLTDKKPPQLESMDMVLHKPNETEKETLDSTQSNFQNETEEPTTEPIRAIFSQLIPVDNKKDKKKEVFTKEKEPLPFSTMLVDTTIPFEELVILTTPPDAEVIEDKGSSMLEAIIILQEHEPTSYPAITTDNTIKRSTKFEPEVSNRQTATYFQQHPTTFSYIFSSLNGVNHTQTTYMSDENHSASLEEQKGNSITNSYEYNDHSEESTSSVENTSETLYAGHTQSMENSVSADDISSGSSFEEEEEASGFPTLEPDTITFPKISDPRLPRSIKSDERPQAQLGNWVGVAATWRSNPTDQWFWTYSGDKLVPVLTYTAFLPYADIPALQAAVLQLPLDDTRYSLLVLLPNSSHGLKQTLHSLQWNSLRTILKSLKPTPVYAVVPAFTIVKHINLTPALHKLGIRNVFDAYVANLGEMSDEPHLYVRSVEQTITISIRKYFANQKWFEASPSQVERNFLATHPFAYFVMDEETKVALIAGTIVDPLQHTT